MSNDQLYKELSGKVGLPNSESLQTVWRMLCMGEEAQVANMLPGTAGMTCKARMIIFTFACLCAARRVMLTGNG